MAQQVRLPDTGEVIEDRRSGPARRQEDRGRGPLGTAWAAVWAVIGSAVVLYLFFVALGAIKPDESHTASIVVLVLAVLWLAHAWRRLLFGGGSPREDRERRGF